MALTLTLTLALTLTLTLALTPTPIITTTVAPPSPFTLIITTKVDPRYLSIRLLSASNLPAMDGVGAKGTTDAYAVAYIVPPDPDLPESPLKAKLHDGLSTVLSGMRHSSQLTARFRLASWG